MKYHFLQNSPQIIHVQLQTYREVSEKPKPRLKRQIKALNCSYIPTNRRSLSRNKNILLISTELDQSLLIKAQKRLQQLQTLSFGFELIDSELTNESITPENFLNKPKARQGFEYQASIPLKNSSYTSSWECKSKLRLLELRQVNRRCDEVVGYDQLLDWFRKQFGERSEQEFGVALYEYSFHKQEVSFKWYIQIRKQYYRLKFQQLDRSKCKIFSRSKSL